MAERFQAVVEEFWFEASHVPKYLARNDLWTAKFRDWATKELLLQMIEWHAQSRCDWTADTRHLGIGMKDWTNPQTLSELSKAFGGFDRAGSITALRATMQLFRRLSRETATNIGYIYPEDLDERFSDHIEKLLRRIDTGQHVDE